MDRLRGHVGWLLAATFLIQVFASLLYRLIPTLTPIFIGYGVINDVHVGYLTSVLTAGCMLSLAATLPTIERLGALRSMQLALVIGSLGAMLCIGYEPLLIFVASLLIGISYAPTITAGSSLLQHYVPEERRNLAFSLKQAGAPVGGALAAIGATVAVREFGLKPALLLIAALSISVALFLEPIRSYVDPACRDRPAGPNATRVQRKSLRDIIQAWSVCLTHPRLRALSITGCFLAVGQGAWFAFLMPYAVLELNWSLTKAGMLFAAIQATSILGRPWLGWLADRSKNPIGLLALIAITSAGCSLAMAIVPTTASDHVYVCLAVVAGLTVASWNGVHVAQTAQYAPSNRIGEAVAGSTMFVFIGYVVGPPLFAIGIGSMGYSLGFILTGSVTLMAIVPLRYHMYINRSDHT